MEVMSLMCMFIPLVVKDAGVMHCLATAPTLVMSVVALLLNVIPHIVAPVDIWQCWVAAPTLMLSTYMMVLYVVDQVLYEAEFYYIVIEFTLTLIAFVNLFLSGKVVGAIYGLFYIDLMIAFGLDFYYMHKERGFTF